jgi:hypothetical protein
MQEQAWTDALKTVGGYGWCTTLRQHAYGTRGDASSDG